jgi:hypothetical protein
MGEIFDWEEERRMAEANSEWEGEEFMTTAAPRNEKGEAIWTTNDGRVIPVRHLTDSHLANCIRFMERRETTNLGIYDALRSEKKKRDERGPDWEEEESRG